MSNATDKISPLHPQHEIVIKAARIIKQGGVVLFPTRYLYGLGADAFNSAAVARVFEIKQRPYHKPLLVLLDKQENLSRLVKTIPPAARRIMDRFWPGDVTIVLLAKANLPENLTAGTGKIGVRMPQHPIARALTNAVEGPITATSANVAGKVGCSQIQDLDPLIAEKLDLILDAGPLEGGIGSTVVDVTTETLKILREGAIPGRDILSALG